MSNANPVSGSGKRDSSGKYALRQGYTPKSPAPRRRSNKKWIRRGK